MADNNFRSVQGRDPIAELARLIAQAYPHEESALADNGFREETASNGYDEPPGLPPAAQLPGYLNAPVESYELDEHRHDHGAYDADDQPCATDEEYQNKVPRLRQRSLALVLAISGLALVGTAGAFSYRNMFGGSVPPSMLSPASGKSQAKNGDNTSQAGTATTGSIENMVSREGRPAGVGTPAAPTAPASGQAVPNQAMPRRVATPPAATAAESKLVGQSSAADVTAAANRAHLAAHSDVLAAADSNAEVTPPVLGSGYAVQVASERSESRAQAAFRALQAKYPNQLSGRQPLIRRADLGAAGTYYRALVGPFASAEKAARLCSGLKAAGGNCIIRKN